MGGRARARGRAAVTSPLGLTSSTRSICSLAGSVPDRSLRRGRGVGRHDGHRRTPRRPASRIRRGGGGVSGRLLRRDARDDGRRDADAGRGDREPDPTEAGLLAAELAMDACIRGHGAAKCAIDIALHDLVGKVLGSPVHVLRGLSADIPPTDFTIGIDEPAIVADVRPGGSVPGAEDQVRRPVRSGDPARGQGGLRALSGSMPTQGGSA